MDVLTAIFKNASARARERRASIFRSRFKIQPDTKILDLGSGDGTNLSVALRGTEARPENVYIADINESLVNKGLASFGFNPVLLSESDRLPFPDCYFDIVFCSSVIEHVTVPKSDVWDIKSGRMFRELAHLRQSAFAVELQRVGKEFFVQTPNRDFIIESYSWLPFNGWFPRRLLLPSLRITNLFWIKKTTPDWNLLTRNELARLFSGAEIIEEKSFGLTKSLMAVGAERH